MNVVEVIFPVSQTPPNDDDQSYKPYGDSLGVAMHCKNLPMEIPDRNKCVNCGYRKQPGHNTASKVDLKFKEKTDDMRREEFHCVRYFHVAYWAAALSLAALAFVFYMASMFSRERLLRNRPDREMPSTIWKVLAIISGVVWAASFILHASRYETRAVVSTWSHVSFVRETNGWASGTIAGQFINISLEELDQGFIGHWYWVRVHVYICKIFRNRVHAGSTGGHIFFSSGSNPCNSYQEILRYRVLMYPKKVYKEWTCPIRCNAFLYPTICLLLFVHFAADPDGADSRPLAKALFWIAAPLQLLVCVRILSQWMYYLRHDDHVSVAWLAVPLSNVFAATAYTAVYPSISRPITASAAQVWMGFAVLLFLALYPMALNRAIMGHNQVMEDRATHWLLAAAPAVLAVGWQSLYGSSFYGSFAWLTTAFGSLYFGSLVLLACFIYGIYPMR